MGERLQELPFFQLAGLDPAQARARLVLIRDYLLEQKRRCEWRIRTLNGTALPAEAATKATLSFDTATNKVAGSTGCNRLMGTYATSGTGITFGPLATTR